jgi:hypothetical protein
MKNPLVIIKNQAKQKLYRFGKDKPLISNSALWKSFIQNNWKDDETFDNAWNSRIEEMPVFEPKSLPRSGGTKIGKSLCIGKETCQLNCGITVVIASL